jgi:hypothetical protein
MFLLNCSKQNFSIFIFSFILFDILFLPYFQLLLFPISLPILLFYFIFIGFNIKIDLQFQLWLFFLITVFLSILHGTLYSHLSVFFLDNIKYFLSFLSLLLFIVFFKSISYDISLSLVNKILKYFILYVSSLSILLLFIPFEILEFISQVYGRTTSDLDGFLSDLRFKYFFQDPNTFAYFMTIILGFLFHSHRKNFELFLFIVLIFFNIIMTQSAGGLFSFLLITILYFFKEVNNTSLSKRILFLLFFILVLSLSFFLIFYFKDKNVFITYFYNRIFETNDRVDSGGGRFAIWAELFHLFPYPIGIGYNLYIAELSKVRSPHSDFFGMIFRYGFLSLIPIIYYFFNKFKSCYYIILPALVTFFINTLFDDQKLIILFFLLTIILHKSHLKRIA